MLGLGVQTHNIVEDAYPQDGFAMIRRACFLSTDFSLNRYLKNTDIYGTKIIHFFSRSVQEGIENFLTLPNIPVTKFGQIGQLKR